MANIFVFFHQKIAVHCSSITKIIPNSIVLLAIVDANWKFIFVDIGSYGKEGDSGIFTKSIISEKMKNGDYFPPKAKIPNSDKILLIFTLAMKHYVWIRI